MSQAVHTVAGLRHSYTVVRGVRVHWAELGATGVQPPLLLLHGMFDSHITWSRLASLLATNRRVLMPDLPGCGLSDRPDASYELSWHTDIMADWLETLALTQMDVVGHSFGGGLAQMLLWRRVVPLPIRRLVLVASGGLGRDVGFLLRLASIPGVVEYFGQPFMAHGTRFVLRAAGEGLSEQYIAELSSMNAGRGSARAFARTLRDVIDWRGQRRMFFEHCDELQLPPTAVFWGDKDPIIPIAHARALVEEFRAVRFHQFGGCGHYIHHERPELFARTLLEFLDDPSVPATHVRPAARQVVAPLDTTLPAQCDPPASHTLHELGAGTLLG